MKKIAVLVMLVAFGATASPAFGQATRTWVSNDTGLGDDANPCSRSAPCRTFAGAISKTIIGGEIDVLDDGGYGTLSITKSITIDGGGHVASVLATGSSFGMSIRIPGGNPNDPNRRVVLRNLTLNGTGTVSGTIGENTGLVGVSVNTDGARSVELDNVRIANFLQHGVKVTPNPLFPSQLDMVLRNVVVADTGTNPGGVPGNAFEIRPTDGAHQVNALIADSEFKGSHAGPGAPSGESGIGVAADTGAHVWLTNSKVFANDLGVQTFGRQGAPGVIDSFCDNQVVGNANDGAFTHEACPVGPPPPPEVITNTVTIKQCVVPSLKGLQLSFAKKLLSAANCRLGKVTRKKTRKRKQVGKVLSQKTRARTTLPEGTKVAVTVGKR